MTLSPIEWFLVVCVAIVVGWFALRIIASALLLLFAGVLFAISAFLGIVDDRRRRARLRARR